MYRAKCSRGFTLAEAMMAVVILSLAGAGVLLPFVSGASVQKEGIRRTIAAGLASDMTERIVATPFEQIVTTYDGYSELQGQMTDSQGVALEDAMYANFSREVSCSYAYVPQESGTRESNFILATVVVRCKGNEMAVINRLISRGG